jgi:hypothetical protein
MAGVFGHGHAHHARQENPISRKIVSFYRRADDMAADPGKGINQRSIWDACYPAHPLFKNGLGCDPFPLSLPAVVIGRGTHAAQ